MFMASLETYQQVLDESGCDEIFRQSQQKKLSAYRDAFSRYAATDENSDIRKQYYEDMRSSAQEMEDALLQVYVPRAEAMVLDIRRNEKDYLLREDEKYVKATHDSITDLLEAFKKRDMLQKNEHMKTAIYAYKEAFDKLVAEDIKIQSLCRSGNA